MSEKMREEFDAWTIKYGFDDGEHMWEAWKASRAALVVELPSLENGLIHPFDGPSMIVDAVAKQLDAAGVSYK